MIALDALIIWALATCRREARDRITLLNRSAGAGQLFELGNNAGGVAGAC